MKKDNSIISKRIRRYRARKDFVMVRYLTKVRDWINSYEKK